MNNFQYWNPVKMIFGKGQIKALSSEIPKNKSPVYGGGSTEKRSLRSSDRPLKGYDWCGFLEFNQTQLLKSRWNVEKIRKETLPFAVGGSCLELRNLSPLPFITTILSKY